MTKKVEIAGHKIVVPDMPDLGRHPTGKITGMRLFGYLFSLFEYNEIPCKPDQRMHDGQLEFLIRDEFEDHKPVIESIENSKVSRICLWRNLYNRGKMGPIKYYSFRYNLSGQPVNARATTILTPEAQRTIINARSIKDPRFAE